MAKEKSRYFTFLLYPESIPVDWEMKLEMLGIPMAVSPLHDKDKSPVEGQEYKKAHYHVIYANKNPVTADSVRKKIKRVLGENSVALVQTVLSIENMYLYLTHESKDAIAQDKYRYNKADIKLLNNFDIDRYITFDAETKTEILRTLLEIICKYKIPNIIDLHEFIEEHGEGYDIDMNLYLSAIEAKSGILRLYLDGAYQRLQQTRVKEKLKQEETTDKDD